MLLREWMSVTVHRETDFVSSPVMTVFDKPRQV